MPAKRTKKGMIVAVFLWVVILGGIAATLRYIVLPKFQKEKQGILNNQTGSAGKYKHHVKLAADSFSGYCLLRSEEMADRLSSKGIKLTVYDDGANYIARMNALKKGDTEMAVFPVNSFIQCGAQIGSFPASIVYIIDETTGADAIIAHKQSLNKISDLNSPDARIVLTPDSPSEFMARVMLASFSLPRLPDDWMIKEDGSREVYKRFRGESVNKPYAYAMWEPDVSKALQEKDAHILIDSSKLKGYIVDVLVVRREFIIDNFDVIKNIIEAYARTVYANRNKMVKMVIADARSLNDTLSEKEASQTVKGIEWKNTLENYAHFGIKNAHSVENIEDIIIKITEVLLKTGALKSDPIDGRANNLYFNKILLAMKENNFHPSREISVISGMDLGNNETLRGAAKLKKLTTRQWLSLVEVGEMRIDPIQFGRGTARVNIKSRRELEKLAKTLKSWPQYYLTVTGQVRPGGNEEEALKLAKARADATVGVLTSNNVPIERIRSFSKIAASDTAEAQSVTFMISQFPY